MKFGLQQKHIDSINSVFAQYPPIDQVFIYGSRAKGNYKNGSDIDLTIIDLNLSYTDRLRIETKIDELLLPYKIDLSQKKEISNPDLIDHINRVGQVFYDKADQIIPALIVNEFQKKTDDL
jgi:predicted nucleotidyltransferase